MSGNITRRLTTAEAKINLRNKEPLRIESFYVEGNEAGVNMEDFLRAQGHDIGPTSDTFAIIRTIIPTENSKAVEAPFVDITSEMRERIGRAERPCFGHRDPVQ